MAEKYSAILKGLYDNYFDAISRTYLRNYLNLEMNLVSSIPHFSKDGIFLNETAGLFAWNDIEVKVYTRLTTLFAQFQMAGTVK